MSELVLSEKFIAFCENEITQNIMELAEKMDEPVAQNIAKRIIKAIDWNNPYLMHKGLYSITELYLRKNKII